MVVFWIIAACLFIAAMLFVLPPLLSRKGADKVIEHDDLNVSVYKDQLAELERDNKNGVITADYYERTKHEIERRLLQDVQNENGGEQAPTTTGPGGRALVIVLALVIPLFSMLLYMELGSPTAVTGVAPVVAGAAEEAPEAGNTPSGKHPDTGDQVEAMVKQLELRMEAQPDDIEGWLMLARSYRFQQRHVDAVAAFEKAMPLVSTNPQLLADLADTLAMAAGGNLDGRPIRLIRQSLELDPANVQSLWLAGTYDFERGDYEQALSYWRTLKSVVEPGSQDANAMDTNIAEVEARIRAAGRIIPPEEEITFSSVKGPTFVAGTVRLDPEYQEKIAPTDTVFIYARAANGPRMPLAMLKKQAQDLPLEFTLDEKMAMMAGMSLADYPQIIVSARISKSGNAMAQSGDFEGRTAVIDVGMVGLDININNEIP
ncbi:Cytochrome c heme lyase subunit CcmH [hydrothermal vent metagenome]|uniref:Cytochrome c heme lyase subunit CcmH n=1 Tax=hydrothermal vent metagenome TaxID=652676 RepID=A0A3B1A2C0_9ZZZZ